VVVLSVCVREHVSVMCRHPKKQDTHPYLEIYKTCHSFTLGRFSRSSLAIVMMSLLAFLVIMFLSMERSSLSGCNWWGGLIEQDIKVKQLFCFSIAVCLSYLNFNHCGRGGIALKSALHFALPFVTCPSVL
jgi:hypothetical protein